MSRPKRYVAAGVSFRLLRCCAVERGVFVPISHEVLRVYEAGPLTVVGFGGAEIPEQIDLTECREEIVSLVKQHDCRVLAFDLTGVKHVPSGMLGLFASLRRLGIEIQLFNPSADVREVLEITRLSRLFKIHDLVL
jgi:anti-anti-sigma factor